MNNNQHQHRATENRKRAYKTPDEIRNAFIAAGWSENTTFTEIEWNGQKCYKMDCSNDVFDKFGELLYFDIPTIEEKKKRRERTQYKQAEPQGEHIDSLRQKYPFRICRTSQPQYEAVLTGIQPLADHDEMPLYRFPGGVCCVEPFENGITIIEW